MCFQAQDTTVKNHNSKKSVKNVKSGIFTTNVSVDCSLMSVDDGKRTHDETYSNGINELCKVPADCSLSTADDGRNSRMAEVTREDDTVYDFNSQNVNSDNVLDFNSHDDICVEDFNSNASDAIKDSTEASDVLYMSLKESRLTNPKSLIFAHININSLKKEKNAPLDYFKDILQRGYIDVLCVSETKLNSSIVDKDLDCNPKFKTYRKDRSSTSGGLCMWIRSDIPQQRLHHLEFDTENYHIESIILELKIKKETWFIILAYKNPNVPKHIFIEKLKGVYEELIHKAHEVITLGDLNIDMLCESNDLKNDICDVYGLENIILEPTCFKNPEGTLVDTIMVKNSKRFKKPLNLFCGYSDWHHLIGCITKLHIPPPKPRKVKYRSFLKII